MTYHLYQLERPDGTPFYVGITKSGLKQRLRSHLSAARRNGRTVKSALIRKYLANGYTPVIRPLAILENDREAMYAEWGYIEVTKGLLNSQGNMEMFLARCYCWCDSE